MKGKKKVVDHVPTTSTTRQRLRKPRRKLRITFPDGTVIVERDCYKTLVQTFKRIGAKRIADLKISGIGDIFFVDSKSTNNEIYRKAQKEIEPGYYVLNYFNADKLKEKTDDISNRLGAGLIIDILP